MYEFCSFEHLMSSYLVPFRENKECDNLQQVESVAATTQISPLAKQAERQLSQRVKQERKYFALLSKADRKRLRSRQVRELNKVLQFYCLDFGCQQLRKENYLSSGLLAMERVSGKACGNACPICTRDWHGQYLPIYRTSLVTFFESSRGQDSFPVIAEDKQQVSVVLWGNVYWIENIFDIASYEIKHVHVDALFLSLAAANIIVLQRHKSTTRWNISWLDDDTPAFQKDTCWQGVNTFPPTRTRMRTPRNVPAHAIVNMQRSMQMWLGNDNNGDNDVVI